MKKLHEAVLTYAEAAEYDRSFVQLRYDDVKKKGSMMLDYLERYAGTGSGDAGKAREHFAGFLRHVTNMRQELDK